MLRYALIILLAAPAVAQQQVSQTKEPIGSYQASVPTGSVTGHITLADSRLPARLTTVGLQPVDLATSFSPALSIMVVQTDMKGDFSIDGVTPGTYYVVAMRLGYLDPFERYTLPQLHDPVPEIQSRLGTLPRVTVAPASTASINFDLHPAASISGRVRAEDGEPFPDATVTYLQRSGNRWVYIPLARTYQGNDRSWITENGEFHIDGLLPGDYVVCATLNRNVIFENTLVGSQGNMMSEHRSTLTLCSGGKPHVQEADPIHLAEGQRATAQDIVVPVSRMRTVTGKVVDAKTGQPLNSGGINLTFHGDMTRYAATASIDPRTRTFTFDFLPDGEYTLIVVGAREIEVPVSKDFPYGNYNQRREIRRYGDVQQPIVVHGNINDLVIPVVVPPPMPPSF